MGRLFGGLVAAMLGAAAALLFDPGRGRARRARLIDQSAAFLRHGARTTERRSRLLGSRAAGMLAAIRARRAPGEAVNDATLKDRVESELLRDAAIPKGAININAEQGVVVLRGEVPDDEMRSALATRAAEIHGVWYVENLLHLPGEPAMTRR